MADKSPIEWTEATWNPLGGCTRVDEACRNCYAEVMAARFSKPGQWGEGLARTVKVATVTSAMGKSEDALKIPFRSDHRWTGKVVLHEAALDRPLRWRRPRLIFVNSTSDLFHESVPDDWIDRVFAVMSLCPQHTFQVLTKRPERVRAYFEARRDGDPWAKAADYIADLRGMENHPAVLEPRDMPLPNVWLGTSISDQASAEARIPKLLACPAAIRFVSAEPLLGPVGLHHYLTPIAAPGRCISIDGDWWHEPGSCESCRASLDWVICGGESGPGARVWPGFEDAARSLRDQCRAAGVAFFMKQMAGPRKSAMPPIPDDLMVREFPHV
jgi:protein gp37